MSLEEDLKRAFRRRDAPPDLAGRVLARTGHGNLQTVPARTKSRLFGAQWLSTAAVIALVAISGTRYYRYHQTVAEAERVQKEVRLALQIAGEKLALVQQKLQESQR